VSPQSGFSLLEMVVAMAILALALGTMYQATSGATRNLRVDERNAYGVELARSLLASSSQVPVRGRSTRGETGSGFRWSVESAPLEFRDAILQRGQLQRIHVSVQWRDGQKTREVTLDSVVEGRVGQ